MTPRYLTTEYCDLRSSERTDAPIDPGLATVASSGIFYSSCIGVTCSGLISKSESQPGLDAPGRSNGRPGKDARKVDHIHRARQVCSFDLERRAALLLAV